MHDWLLPPARFPRDNVPKYAASLLLVGFGLACAFACAYFAITEIMHTTTMLGVVYSIAAIGCIVCVIAFRQTARMQLWGNAFIGLLFVVSALANFGTGGQIQGVNMVLPTLVVVAALMLDIRSALVWSVLILAQMLIANQLAQTPANWYPVQIDRAWDSTAYQRVPLVMTLLSIFLAIWFKGMIGRIQRHLLEAHQSEAAARRESERLNKVLGEMAAIDPLTGLLNRRAFHDVMAHRDANAEHWLLYADLDGFKAINDSLGHEAGDRVLVDVARLLDASGADAVARLGGDEFCLLIDGNEFRVRQCAERVVQSIAAMITGGPTSPRIGASVGIARANGVSVEAAMRAADAACYQAKRGGKSRFVIAAERRA